MHERLKPYYSEIGRPSVDPELMIRMLIVGYCYGLRSERRLTQEVELHLAYRWFCWLDLDDKVPHHSTFSENRLHRFRESDVFRHIFERVVMACMAAGLVKGEGFAVDASVMEANASRYHGKAPDEIAWAEPERRTRAVKEYLAALEAEAEGNPDRKPPKVISPSDPCSAWTAKANKRVQFGYGLNYLIDIENTVIVDVEATPARTYDEVAATKTMIERLHLSQQQGATHQRHRARRTDPSLSRLQARLRCLCAQGALLPRATRKENPTRRSRGSPRCGASADGDEGLPQVA
jgi:transposase